MGGCNRGSRGLDLDWTCSISYGTMAVTMPAPQKKAFENWRPSGTVGPISSGGGCQSLNGLYGESVPVSSMSATNLREQSVGGQRAYSIRASVSIS